MVGNSTWQTLENADLIALLATKNNYSTNYLALGCGQGKYVTPGASSTPAFEGMQLLDTSKSGHRVGKYKGMASTIDPFSPQLGYGGGSYTYEAWLPLNIFCSGGPSRSHLVAGAPHQSFRIKLQYANQGTVLTSVPDGATTTPTVELWARQHVMTNFERTQIRTSTIAKTLHMTQHIEKTLPVPPSTTAKQTVDVELDSFSLLASHLLISLEGTLENDGNDDCNFEIVTAELLLNTSSHSGRLDGSFMRTMTGASMGLETFDLRTMVPETAKYANTDSAMAKAHLVSDSVAVADLGFAGISSDATNAIKRNTSGETLNVRPLHIPLQSTSFITNTSGTPVYVFPIASKAYGPDSCPLNRFDTIRLKLELARIIPQHVELATAVDQTDPKFAVDSTFAPDTTGEISHVNQATLVSFPRHFQVDTNDLCDFNRGATAMSGGSDTSPTVAQAAVNYQLYGAQTHGELNEDLDILHPRTAVSSVPIRPKSAPNGGVVSVTCVGTASAIYANQAASLQYHS
jgi:hypothetical protein